MDDDERTGAEILVDALAAAIPPTPFGIVRLRGVASFSPSPIEQDPDFLVPREIAREVVAEIRLIPSND